MSRRSTAAANPRRIAGPTSALTDYLAANNISAADIARNARNRQQQALADAMEAGDSSSTQRVNGNASSSRVRGASSANSANSASSSAVAQTGTLPSGLPSGLANSSSVAAMATTLKSSDYSKALSKVEAKAIAHYQTTAQFRQAKRHYKGDEEDDETLARMFYFAAKKSVGQLENCVNCSKRFTVTNYTLAALDCSGLLCQPCGRTQAAKQAEEGPKMKKPKTSGGPVGQRRKAQSRILDGSVPFGAKSLVTLCIERLSKNIDLAEDLGILPDHVIDRIARILSKRRVLSPKTLNLFLQPGTRILKIYDAAKLKDQDFICALQALPDLEVLKVKCGIQFKNEVVEYLATRPIALKSLSLSGSNLITDETWQKYLAAKGASLEHLSVSFNDNYFRNETVASVARHCPRLRSLKIKYNARVDVDAMGSIKALPKLQHLCLRLQQVVPNPAYVSLLEAIGPRLQTLSLIPVQDQQLNDTVLDAVHRSCRSLMKLRIVGAELVTDHAWSRLFAADWQNPPLVFADFSKCRIAGSTCRGTGNPERLGLCDAGFAALMAHSGRKLRHLSIESCHHVSRATFLRVFSSSGGEGEGGSSKYPELEKLDLSFCDVDDYVIRDVFKACPALREVKVFGCMKVRNVPVPRGKVLIGVSNAVGMRIEGTF